MLYKNLPKEEASCFLYVSFQHFASILSVNLILSFFFYFINFSTFCSEKYPALRLEVFEECL